MDKVKLICVTPNNNNKFYNMEDLDNGKFKVEYGRVGSSSTEVIYPIKDWDKKYKEKIKKGYVDISETLTQIKKESELDIKDDTVKEMISYLMKCAKQLVKNNYNVDIENISELQINKVQGLIDEVAEMYKQDKNNINKINQKLQEIYTIIPRYMTDTRYYFIQQNEEDEKVLKLFEEEQNKLNTLKSQIGITKKTNNKATITLEDLGFDCRLATQEEKEYIKKNTDFRLTYHKVFKVTNKETEDKFNPKHLKTKLLYHGSRNENFLSILQTGLKIRPKGVHLTGSMFGNGIYAANKARKSIGYTSLSGSYWAGGNSNKAYLAIFEFATGNEWNILHNKKYEWWMGNLTKEEVNKKGYDSVYAEKGLSLQNDEYIVYDSNQCTIRYLIELEDR